MNLQDRLSQPLHASDISLLSKTTTRDEVYSLLFSIDKRTSDNAAWVMTHWDKSANPWIATKRDELMAEVMRTASITKQRLCLTLLARIQFSKTDVRTDFLDFCINQFTANSATGVRSVCMKLAYQQCRHYPELLAELQAALEMIQPDTLTAGARQARQNILKKIQQHNYERLK